MCSFLYNNRTSNNNIVQPIVNTAKKGWNWINNTTSSIIVKVSEWFGGGSFNGKRSSGSGYHSGGGYSSRGDYPMEEDTLRQWIGGQFQLYLSKFTGILYERYGNRTDEKWFWIIRKPA